jgi:ABC-type Fe3+-hydroxamate transport system substrate-binding protein
VGTYKELGALLDREEVAADLAQGIEAVLAETAASSQALSGDSPRACLLYSYEPPYFSAGEGTFPSALLSLAGFKNIADTALLPWPQLSLEWLVKQNPEFIFIATGSNSRPVENELSRLRASGVWAQISASIPGLRTLDALAVFSAARAEIP